MDTFENFLLMSRLTVFFSERKLQKWKKTPSTSLWWWLLGRPPTLWCHHPPKLPFKAPKKSIKMKLVVHAVSEYCHMVHQITNHLHQNKDNGPPVFKKRLEISGPSDIQCILWRKKCLRVRPFKPHWPLKKGVVSLMFDSIGWLAYPVTIIT